MYKQHTKNNPTTPFLPGQVAWLASLGGPDGPMDALTEAAVLAWVWTVCAEMSQIHSRF